jgi:hypothetical protein
MSNIEELPQDEPVTMSTLEQLQQANPFFVDTMQQIEKLQDTADQQVIILSALVQKVEAIITQVDKASTMITGCFDIAYQFVTLILYLFGEIWRVVIKVPFMRFFFKGFTRADMECQGPRLSRSSVLGIHSYHFIVYSVCTVFSHYNRYKSVGLGSIPTRIR